MLRLPVISVEHFDIVTHSCATSFSIKLHFMKLTIYLIAATNSNLTILIHHSKNSLEKKSKRRRVSECTPAVIYKKRLSHGSKIVQYFWNYKRQEIDEDNSTFGIWKSEVWPTILAQITGRHTRFFLSVIPALVAVMKYRESSGDVNSIYFWKLQ